MLGCLTCMPLKAPHPPAALLHTCANPFQTIPAKFSVLAECLHGCVTCMLLNSSYPSLLTESLLCCSIAYLCKYILDFIGACHTFPAASAVCICKTTMCKSFRSVTVTTNGLVVLSCFALLCKLRSVLANIHSFCNVDIHSHGFADSCASPQLLQRSFDCQCLAGCSQSSQLLRCRVS